MTQKGTVKSRVGCAACKVKRIKCDEAKPECRACISRGRTCPGYRRQLKWSTKYEVSLDIQRQGPPNLDDLAIATSLSVSGTSAPTDPVSQVEQSGPRSRNLEDGTVCSSLAPFLSSSPSDHAASILDVNAAFPDSDDIAVQTVELDNAYSDQSFWSDDFWLDVLDENTHLPDVNLDLVNPALSHPQPVNFLNTERTPGTNKGPLNRKPPDAFMRHYVSGINRPLTDLPTFLIEHWFRTVCTIWSGFDSITNLNRQFASDAVSNSEGLFFSLQSMSAAHLADRLPHLKVTALDAATNAVRAIRRDLSGLNSTSSLTILPSDLILSMFCVGTSGCWIDPRQLGLPFLREIKALLKRFNMHTSSLTAADQRALSFFNNSCLYWDMLCRVVADPEDILLENGWSNSQDVKAHEYDVLHPWTGISTTVLEIFSECVALCRRFCLRKMQLRRPTSSALQAALLDVQRAEQLYKEVQELHIPRPEDLPETGDSLTPSSHLVHVAEAYRLASLLQLNQTFPDLHYAAQCVSNTDGELNSELRKLALMIIDILEKIPLPSGTHSIQPMLYISASTGLKYDMVMAQLDLPTRRTDEIYACDLHAKDTSDWNAQGIHDYSRDNMPQISETSIEIGHARHFVLERLGALERRLPAQPISVAKKLVQQIWLAYDKEEPSINQIHWIDVMKQTGLQTIFG